jgi:predicted dehydrogenase
MIDGLLGVAVHGAGSVARAHVASWQRNPRVRIVSVSSARKESAAKLVREEGLDCEVRERFEDVLRDSRVDIVNISGPHYVHSAQGIASAEAGKHLLMEKPLGIDLGEGRALRDAVVRNGVRSVVSYVLRWNPLFDNLKGLLAAGAVGKLFHLEVDYWHGISYTGWNWIRSKATGGSAMLAAGCHAVDSLRFFAGDEPAEVCAFSSNPLGRYEYDSSLVAIVKFRSGMTGKTSVFFDAEIPYAFNINLLGTEGTLRDNRVWSRRLFPAQTGWATVPTILPDSGDVHHHPFDAEVNHLVECIVEGRESHASIADAFHTHEFCIALDRSAAAGGAPVRLPLA